MAQQTINVGAYVGDPDADTTRAAFQKSQANFTDLYTGAASGALTLATQPSATPGLTASNFLDREHHVDNYGAVGDGVTDDSAAFVKMFTDLALHGGGTGKIHPQKRYAVLSQPILMPPNTHLTCDGYPQSNNSYTYSTMGGVILLPPGVPVTGAVGANFYNPQRTTMALSMSDTCKVSNICFISTNFTQASNVVTVEALVAQFPTNGNAVQLDGAFCEVHNCFFIGFSKSIVNTNMKVTAYFQISSIARASNVATIVTTATNNLTTGQLVSISGVTLDTTFNAMSPVSITVINSTTFTYSNTGANLSTTTSAGVIVGALVGSAGASPRVEKCEGDGNTLLLLGNNGLGGYCNRLRHSNFATSAAGVGGRANLGFTVGTDGAGGTLLTGLTWNNTAISWPSTLIGTPSVGGTVTLSMVDSAGIPCANSSDTRSPPNSRYIGVWQSAGGSAWNIQIPNMPYTNWMSVDAYNGSVTLVASDTPTNAAFSAAVLRSGPAIYLDNIQSAKITEINLLGGSGVYIQQSSSIHLSAVDGDCGVRDTGGACGGYAINIDSGSSNIIINDGYVLGTWGGIVNYSSAVGNVILSNFSLSGPRIAINQQGNAMVMVGGQIGKGYVVYGNSHSGLTLTGVAIPPATTDSSLLRLALSGGISALAPYIDPNCPGVAGAFNAPAAMLTWLTTTFPQSLPTTLPSAAGTLWNDNGVLAVS